MIQRGCEFVAEVDTQHAAAATHERAEVAKRLRLFQNGEGVRLAGDGKISFVFGLDLKEHSGVWATFVKLPG